MASPKVMSPAATSRRRTTALTWGVLLVLVWLLAVLGAATSSARAAGSTALVVGLVALLPGAVMACLGVKAEVRARRFNRLDWALAESLADACGGLCRTPPFEAYRLVDDAVTIREGRLIEIERHFDQRTAGTVTGRLTHQLSFFGGTLSASYGRFGVGGLAGAVNGMSRVELGVEQTTRTNLMGDALFAVLEAPGPAGSDDAYRVVSVSAAAAAEWVQLLVFATIDRLEGTRSYAGATLANWSARMVNHFAPADISYASDRLRAQASRAPERRDPLTVRGLGIGRNAVLAANVQIGAEPPLLLFPVLFPVLFGRAVAEAAHRADVAVRPSEPAQRLHG